MHTNFLLIRYQLFFFFWTFNYFIFYWNCLCCTKNHIAYCFDYVSSKCKNKKSYMLNLINLDDFFYFCFSLNILFFYLNKVFWNWLTRLVLIDILLLALKKIYLSLEESFVANQLKRRLHSYFRLFPFIWTTKRSQLPPITPLTSLIRFFRNSWTTTNHK